MNGGSLLLMAPARWGHVHAHGGAVHGLLGLIVHAAIWSSVSRVIRHLPGGMFLLVAIGACGLFLWLRRRRA